ncbi:hypothetical protein [Bacteroides stercorirosoris]|uniref:hypothetical protein n=1 Tax=Bacteroides stercorirosoris TaxID=871324 RepID=UPI00351FFBD3
MEKDIIKQIILNQQESTSQVITHSQPTENTNCQNDKSRLLRSLLPSYRNKREMKKIQSLFIRTRNFSPCIVAPSKSLFYFCALTIQFIT